MTYQYIHIDKEGKIKGTTPGLCGCCEFTDVLTGEDVDNALEAIQRALTAQERWYGALRSALMMWPAAAIGRAIYKSRAGQETDDTEKRIAAYMGLIPWLEEK